MRRYEVGWALLPVLHRKNRTGKSAHPTDLCGKDCRTTADPRETCGGRDCATDTASQRSHQARSKCVLDVTDFFSRGRSAAILQLQGWNACSSRIG